MKQIKLILVTTCTCLAFFAFSLFQSCKPDTCKKLNCLNGGVCETGKCKCATGYEGSQCEISKLTKYYGVYRGSATDNFGNVYNGWSIKVEPNSASSDAVKVSVYNSANTEEIAFNGKINFNGAIVMDSVRRSNRKYNNARGKSDGSYLSVNYIRSHGYADHKPNYNSAIGLVYDFDFQLWK